MIFITWVKLFSSDWLLLLKNWLFGTLDCKGFQEVAGKKLAARVSFAQSFAMPSKKNECSLLKIEGILHYQHLLLPSSKCILQYNSDLCPKATSQRFNDKRFVMAKDRPENSHAVKCCHISHYATLLF